MAVSYRRVSTGRQDAENQRADVERVARARGYELVGDYVETVSATAAKRPAFDELLDDARAGRFNVLVIWAIDRIGRSLTRNLVSILELDRLGVHVVSVREPWLDTGGPVRDLLVAIFSWVAEQERRQLGERTRAGLERARARGSRLGRPRRYVTPAELERARKLWAAEVPIRVIAQRVHVPRATLHRLVSETGSGSGPPKPRAAKALKSATRKRTIGGR